MSPDSAVPPDPIVTPDSSALPEPSPPALHGILVIDKPAGLTSRDIVNRVVQRMRLDWPRPIKLPKAGHAGTLDPLATGVLLVGVGAGVRLVPYLQQQTKRYRATFRLGQSTVSGDLETPLIHQDNPPRPTREQLQLAAESLTGTITQIPPAHSAIKVEGRKAYKSAHRGQAVAVPPRTVQVDRFQITAYRYPDVDVEIVCGSGTYVRTLGIDLAAACGTTAVMTRLTRTAIGAYRLDAAIPLQRLEDADWHRSLQPLIGAAAVLVQLTGDSETIDRLVNGQKVVRGQLTPLLADGAAPPPPAAAETPETPEAVGPAEAAVRDADGRLRAIVRRRGPLWCPYRVFPPT